MEFRVGAMNNGYSQVKPLNYGLSNQSVTSTGFAEALKNMGGANDVGVVAPVQYPNARLVSPVEKAEETVKMSAVYNDIARGFQGPSTEYNRGGQAKGYEMIGATLDLYA